jgi:hypothetical protein
MISSSLSVIGHPTVRYTAIVQCRDKIATEEHRKKGLEQMVTLYAAKGEVWPSYILHLYVGGGGCPIAPLIRRARSEFIYFILCEDPLTP